MIKQFKQEYGFNKEYINALINDKDILNYFNNIHELLKKEEIN